MRINSTNQNSTVVQEEADEALEDEERPAQLQICMSIANTGDDEFSFQARLDPCIHTMHAQVLQVASRSFYVFYIKPVSTACN